MLKQRGLGNHVIIQACKGQAGQRAACIGHFGEDNDLAPVGESVQIASSRMSRIDGEIRGSCFFAREDLMLSSMVPISQANELRLTIPVPGPVIAGASHVKTCR